MRKLKLLPIFSLLLSLNMYASDKDVFGDENTPPAPLVSKHSVTLGLIALSLKEGRTNYDRYLACFHNIVADKERFTSKEAFKITILLKEMGDMDRYNYALEKLRRGSIPDIQASLNHFSKILGKPDAFENLKNALTPGTPKRKPRGELYVSPTSEEDGFYNPRREKRPRITSPQSSTGNAIKRSNSGN